MEAIRDLIRPHTGEVHAWTRPEHGVGTDLTGTIACEKGTFFVKAMRTGHRGRLNSITRERDINPYVLHLSPVLRWWAEDGEWMVLGFEPAKGRYARFRPGSSDLPGVAGLINQVQATAVPEVADSWSEYRWWRYTAPDERDLLAGDTLIHGDINPFNILIGDGRTWLVDWAWPTHGAAFINPSLWVVQLIAAGHVPAQAEAWAMRSPGFSEASRQAVDVFAAAQIRMYEDRVGRGLGQVLPELDAAARSWANHRGVAP